MARATITVEVSFTTDPLDTPSWTDITAYVKSVATKTGRSRELGPFDVGTAQIELDNSGRRFDPFYSAGPYFGNLTPNKALRIRATYNSNTYDLFYGYVDGWPQSYAPPAESSITISASDAFKLLSTMPLPSSVYAMTVEADTPHAWYRFDDETGSTFKDSSGNDRDLTIYADVGGRVEDVQRKEGLFPDSPKAVIDTQELATLPAPDIVQTTFSVEFWFWGENSDACVFEVYEPGDPASPSIVYPELTIGSFLTSATPSADHQRIWWTWDASNYVKTTNRVAFDGRLHHVVATKSGSTVHIHVDGVDQPLTTVGSVGSMPFVQMRLFGSAAKSDGTNYTQVPKVGISDFAFYDSVFSASQSLNHYNMGLIPWDGDRPSARINRVLDLVDWPASLRYVAEFGSDHLGPARLGGRSVTDYLRIVESSEQSQIFIDHRIGGKVRYYARNQRFEETRSTVVQYAFSDDPAGVGVYRYLPSLDLAFDERDIVNEVKVKWQQGTETVEDADSIAAYGRRSLPIETEITTKTTANGLGNWVLNRYKDPAVRCRSIELDPSANNAAFLPALEVMINDRLSVRRLPQGIGTAFTKYVMVEGIEHTIRNGVNTWTTRFLCSETDAEDYWEWGIATWGETTRWVF